MPSLYITRTARMSASGHICRMMPAMKVPCPESESRVPSSGLFNVPLNSGLVAGSVRPSGRPATVGARSTISSGSQ